MRAFEVFTNGKKRYTAGGEYQTLTAALTLIHTDLPKPNDATVLFSTTGINPEEMVKVGSWPTDDLTVGDRVEIRVVEISEAGAPESTETHQRADDNDDA